MSYAIEITGKIKKDIKLAQKRGLNVTLLKDVISTLEDKGRNFQPFTNRTLKANYKGLWECHIQSDWLLIWEQNETIKLITLYRTGTHSDLFK